MRLQWLPVTPFSPVTPRNKGLKPRGVRMVCLVPLGARAPARAKRVWIGNRRRAGSI